MRDIIFRRSHFDVNGKLITTTYWGKIDHNKKSSDDCFSSITSITSSVTTIDDQFNGLNTRGYTENGTILLFSNKKEAKDWCLKKELER